MKKHIQHIAIILLLFIAYPYVFQAVHILSHDHSHASGNRSANSGYYHSCSLHDHCDNPAGNQEKPDGLSFSGPYFEGIPGNSDHEHEQCPLCEHEFAKFSVKSIFYTSFEDERFSLVNNYFYQVPSVLYTGHHRSFRAPPSVL
jgi:hypothetical protein